jgi:low temperature requirement protein LtrA
VSVQLVEREQRVTPLELFFDLVFVFALTQVTMLLSDNPTWSGLGHSLLILGTLWWVWSSYAWLTNSVDAERGVVGATILAAMAAMFVAALAVPGVFGDDGGVFGVAFLVVALMQLALFTLSSRSDRDLGHALLRVAPWSLTGALLIMVAGFVHGGLKPVLWFAALLIGFVGPFFAGVDGFRLHPAHFVERHGLIVIIAIGEALVAIGVGARGVGLDTSVIVAAVLGFAVAASFWLAYFDFFTIRAQQLLIDRTGSERVALARDAYTYLHLPMIVGIVLFAFAVKTTIAHDSDDLATIPAVCLCCGPALYLFAYVGVRARISHTFRGGRLVAAVACVALLPVALAVPALVALALMAALWAALHAYELIWFSQARAETRAQRAPEVSPLQSPAPPHPPRP